MPTSSPKAVLVIVHGMMEHANRYQEFARFFEENNILTISADLPGHGQKAYEAKELGHWHDGAWKDCLSTIDNLIEEAVRVGKGAPIFVFGHSMGSFLAMQAAYTHPAVQGLILTGMTKPPKLLLQVGRLLASILDITAYKIGGLLQRVGLTQLGESLIKKRSQLLHKLTFHQAEKSLKNKYDWLSMDASKVANYANDPLCGKVCSANFYKELFNGILSLYAMTPSHKCDTYILSGDKDPIGSYGKEPRKWRDLIAKKWKIDVKFEAFIARHELINEIQRKTIYNRCLSWIESKI